MGKIEDLNTLVRLLKEFEFPVSPILEYAIKEKFEQLSSDEGSYTIDDIARNVQNVKTEETTIETKQKLYTLRVVRDNGTVIECEKAANTLCQVIKEVGVEKVYSLKIPLDGMYLVTKGGNPYYPSAQHDLGNGFFVNSHSDTHRKKRLLERIFTAFRINWKVEII